MPAPCSRKSNERMVPHDTIRKRLQGNETTRASVGYAQSHDETNVTAHGVVPQNIRTTKGIRHMKRPWHDTVLLDLLAGYGAFIVLAVAIVAVSECTARPAHAELSLDLAGGATQFQITAADGDYLQRGLPHTLDQTSFAYRVGLCWALNERWSSCGAYLN